MKIHTVERYHYNTGGAGPYGMGDRVVTVFECTDCDYRKELGHYDEPLNSERFILLEHMVYFMAQELDLDVNVIPRTVTSI